MNNAHAIAAFIGARLQHPVPMCNSNNPRVSTIRVNQYKSKFNDVRVYCELAHPDEVQKFWEEEMNQSHVAGLDHLVKFAYPPQTFIDMCWLRDAQHYRRCYLEMDALTAEWISEDVCVSADWGILLLQNEEQLVTWIERDETRYNEPPHIGDKKFESYDELKTCVMGIMKRVG